MNTIGDVNLFAIRYKLKRNPFSTKGLYNVSWGQLELWVHNKEICGYRCNGKMHMYEFNLLGIIEWFCLNLKYILGNDPFPISIAGKNALEIYNNSFNLDLIQENSETLFEARQDWYSRHNWFWARDGSFLADVFYRKIENYIEISWDNVDSFKNEGIIYINPKGSELIPLDFFRITILTFLEHIIMQLSSFFPSNDDLLTLNTQLKDLIQKM